MLYDFASVLVFLVVGFLILVAVLLLSRLIQAEGKLAPINSYPTNAVKFLKDLPGSALTSAFTCLH